jgi:hypothetical protein
MNCFQKAINLLGLNVDSQGELGWAYLLLSAMAEVEAANPTANRYDNAFLEVSYRLEPYGGHAIRRLAVIFGARTDA